MQGSDVVQKEMYTFSDRSDRSLTLRPEGTAPICRAYVEHGLHREPQPAKLSRSRPCIATERPAEAGTASTGRPRSRRSEATTRRSTPSSSSSTTPSSAASGVTRYELELNSIGCRECRPAYLEELRVLARRERGAPRRGDAGEGVDEPAPRLRQLRGQAGARARCARRGAEDRRLALLRLRRALRGRPRRPRRDRRPLHGRADSRPRPRLLLAHDLGVHRPARERERDALGRRSLRLPRRGDRRPADARRRVRRRHRAPAARPRGGGRGAAEAPAIDVFFAREPDAPRERRPRVARTSCARPGSRATPTTRAAR